MNTLLTLLAGAALALLVLSLRNVRRFYCPNWLLRALGEVPWAPGLARHMRAVGNEHLQPTHEVYFVNRQEIAECGVACPKCTTEVAERGDFSRVMRAMVDGQENEVVKCQGVIDLGDGSKPRPCPAWLAASPNTEHGDHLTEGDPLEFYVFSRITAEQAMREKYGMDIKPGIDGLAVDPQARPEGSVPHDDVIIGAFVPPSPAAETLSPVGVAIPADTVTSPPPVLQSTATYIDRSKPNPADAETRQLPAIQPPPKDT